MPCLSQDGYRQMCGCIGKLKNVEILQQQTHTFYTSKKQPKDYDPKFPRHPKLKEFYCKKGARTGWLVNISRSQITTLGRQ